MTTESVLELEFEPRQSDILILYACFSVVDLYPLYFLTCSLSFNLFLIFLYFKIILVIDNIVSDQIVLKT